MCMVRVNGEGEGIKSSWNVSKTEELRLEEKETIVAVVVEVD